MSEIVLPKGVVCDNCNHGTLARLDAALIDFTPVSLMRTFFGVESKSGKLPSTKLSNATLKMTAPGHVELDSNSDKAFTVTDSGLKMRLRGNRKVTPKQLNEVARALFKMTLGCMYIDLPDIATSKKFDSLRRIILGEDNFSGYVTVVTRAWVPTLMNSYTELNWDFLKPTGSEPAVWARFDFLKISLYTDMENRSPQKPKLYPGDKAEILQF